MALASIEEAIADFETGKFVIIVDDEDRENEGDLVIAAEHCTADAVNFMAREGRGLICISMSGERLDQLGIPLMVLQDANNSGFGTGFTISVEAKHGVTTGISAADRAKTIATLIDPNTTEDEIAMPGHMFPLRARDGGVLARRGQTEASVDLARLSGLYPAGVICEVMAADGTMMRLPQLVTFGAEHGIKIISVEQLAAYRRQYETAVDQLPPLPTLRRSGTAPLPTSFGNFIATAFLDGQGKEHLLLSMSQENEEEQAKPPIMRIHSECLTGDLFGSFRCDCGEQLQSALYQIAKEGRGMLLYLRQEGRGIGLVNKMRAYELQDAGMDTVDANLELGLPADARQYDVAAAILQEMGVSAVRLMTNNPEKLESLQIRGISVTRVSHQIAARKENFNYLKTKLARMGHLLDLNGQGS